MRKCYLMHEESHVLRIDLDSKIFRVELEALLPYGLKGVDFNNFELGLDALTAWLQNRVINVNRANYHALLKLLTITDSDFIGMCMCIAEETHLVSAVDDYWIDGVWSSTSWSDIKHIKTSTVVEECARFGYRNDYNIGSNVITPEYTTGGSRVKFWTTNLYISYGRGTLLLCKKSPDTIETRISSILKRLNVEHVSYVHQDIDGKSYDVCNSIKDIIDSKHRRPVSIMLASEYLLYCDRIGISVYDTLSSFSSQYANMACADYLIGNMGRKLSNIGLLWDARTGIITGLAPLFGHDESFMYEKGDIQSPIHSSMSMKELAISQVGKSTINFNADFCNYLFHSLMEYDNFMKRLDILKSCKTN